MNFPAERFIGSDGLKKINETTSKRQGVKDSIELASLRGVKCLTCWVLVLEEKRRIRSVWCLPWSWGASLAHYKFAWTCILSVGTWNPRAAAWSKDVLWCWTKKPTGSWPTLHCLPSPQLLLLFYSLPVFLVTFISISFKHGLFWMSFYFFSCVIFLSMSLPLVSFTSVKELSLFYFVLCVSYL